MTNSQVKQAFMNQKRGAAANLTSDGTSIWSYGWWEIARWVPSDWDGQIITRKGKPYSMTTATKHRPGVYGQEAENETPSTQGVMLL